VELGVARRYARALLVAAKKQQSVIEAQQDLDAIVQILEAKPELKEFLESPKQARDQKREMIDKLFADKARPITLQLMRLLIEKRRENIFQLIRDEYQRLREHEEGILRIRISSAQPLDENQKQSLIKRIEQETKRKVIAETEVDPQLIGGVTIRYGDFLLDGSIAGALKRLREKLYIDVLKQT
jgi:F-type H+-transporting ATPase subunit delta